MVGKQCHSYKSRLDLWRHALGEAGSQVGVIRGVITNNEQGLALRATHIQIRWL